jgi:hypothetical protein
MVESKHRNKGQLQEEVLAGEIKIRERNEIVYENTP